MKIKVKDIEEKGSIHLSYNEEPASLGLDEGTINCLSLVGVDVHLNRTRNGVYAAGRVWATLGLSCSRCLERFPYRIDEEFYLEYRPRPAELPAETELDEEAVGIVFFDGAEIDLSDQMRQDVLLALPMKPVCDESCKGLCPICGGNLNEVQCDCSSIVIDSPFSTLRGLRLE